MPPWKPAVDSPEFIGDKTPVGSREADPPSRWVADGMPEGEADHRAQASGNGGWVWGTPDLVIELPEYVLAAGSSDCFEISWSARRLRVLAMCAACNSALEAARSIMQTSGSIQHRRPPNSIIADPTPGYEGVILHSAQFPDGYFLGWTPGQAAPPDDQLAWPLQGQSDFVVQLHMRSTGQADVVRPLLGLYFSPKPPGQRSHDDSARASEPSYTCRRRTLHEHRLPAGAGADHASWRFRRIRITVPATFSCAQSCRTERSALCCTSMTGTSTGRISIGSRSR